MANYNQQTGIVENADPALAEIAIQAFILDMESDAVSAVRLPEQDQGEGWFAFLLRRENRCCVVWMPGIEVDSVRFISGQGNNPLEFPRVFVDANPRYWVGSAVQAGSILYPR